VAVLAADSDRAAALPADVAAGVLIRAAAFSPASAASGLAGYAAYSPYGTVTAAGGAMPGIGYQGDYTDPTTGLVHMGVRWYDPAAGAFTSSDTVNGAPVPSAVDSNPYAYAGGNPLTETDPSGHCSWLGCLSDAGHYVMTGLVAGEQLAATYLAPAAVASWGATAAVGGFTALFTGLSWVFADSTESGCQDVICSQPDYGGGSPAPSWGPAGTPGSGAGGSEPNGSSGTAGAGTGPCTIACAPPPPPPPPPDCYAGPTPTCRVPNAPGSLLHTPLITSVVKNIISYAELCRQGDCLNETNKSKQGAVKGATPSSNENPANTDDADQNDQQLLRPIQDQGTQPTPSAGGASGGSNIGGGGNNACDEPVENSKLGDYQFEQIAASFEGISKISAGTSAFTAAVSGTGSYLWTVGEGGELNMVEALSGIYHSIAADGGPVMAAGEISFKDGRVTSFNNRTGHYTPTPECSGISLGLGYDAFLGQGVGIPLNVMEDLGGSVP
jgi:RHS repeat-associated protein